MQDGSMAIVAVLISVFMFLISAGISVAIGAGIYMLACLVYNLLAENLGSKPGPAPRSPQAAAWSPGGYAPPGGNPYAAPQTVAKNYVRRTSKNNVPIHSYPMALLIVFLSALSAFGLWLCLLLLMVAAAVVKLPALVSLIFLAGILLIVVGSFCLMCAIGSKYLPTSFGKATLVTLLFYAIYFFISLFMWVMLGSFAAVFR